MKGLLLDEKQVEGLLKTHKLVNVHADRVEGVS